jgi:thiol-disulfide isomerase/thioredoxin
MNKTKLERNNKTKSKMNKSKMKKSKIKKSKIKKSKVKKSKVKKSKIKKSKIKKSKYNQLRPMKQPFMELLYFHMEGCGYCKKFEPIWMALKNKIKGIKLVKINGPENRKLATKFKVSGYPTIILIKGKYNIVYEGKRDINELIKFYNMVRNSDNVITKNIKGKKYIVT